MLSVSDRIVHLCYAGTSGATTAAVNIARGSTQPPRHVYVFHGVVPLRTAWAEQLRQFGCQFLYAPKRPGLDPAGYRRAALGVCRLRPRVAVFHGAQTLPVLLCFRAMRPSVPVIGVHHGPLSDLDRPAGRMLWAVFARMASRNVAASPSLVEQVRHHRYVARAAGEMVTIPNAIDVAYWQARPPRIDPNRALTVGMVGTLEWTKDQETLIAAVGELRRRGRDVAAELIGSGPQRRRLEALAERLGVSSRVAFLGDQPPAEVRRRMHRWDIQVHATHGEVLSLAVLEGMAAGRPIVATDSAGMRSVIADERTGLLVPPGDPRALAEALVRLGGDPALAGRLAAAGRERVRRQFAVEQMARRYERLAQELIATGRRRWS